MIANVTPTIMTHDRNPILRRSLAECHALSAASQARLSGRASRSRWFPNSPACSKGRDLSSQRTAAPAQWEGWRMNDHHMKNRGSI
jgi:hypothetical protein